MIEERFESYVYQIMKYVKYQENKPYIESILEDMKYELFREARLYKKALEQENNQLKENKKKAIECIKTTIEIIKEQPSSCELNDIWTLEHLNSFLEILGDKENE